MAAASTHADPVRRLAAMRARSRSIRIWVACAAVTLFIVFFSLIYVQLSRSSTVTTKTVSASSQSSASAASSTSSQVVQSAPAPMVTQQS